MSLGLNSLDAAGLCAAVLCVLMAWRRSHQAELAALAGSLAVFLAGCWGAPVLAPLLPVGTPGGPLNLAAALVVVFSGGLAGAWLVVRLGPLLAGRRRATWGERALAAAFGVLRAWVLGLMVATVAVLTPAAQSAAWQASALAGLLGAGVRGALPLLPPGLAGFLSR